MHKLYVDFQRSPKELTNIYVLSLADLIHLRIHIEPEPLNKHKAFWDLSGASAWCITHPKRNPASGCI